MKKVNLYLQVLVFASVILLILGNFLFPGIIIYVLYIQFLLGIYQYLVGSYLFLFLKRVTQFRLYWLLATTNLLLIIGGAVLEVDATQWINMLCLFIIPWLLSLCFFWLSYKLFRKS